MSRRLAPTRDHRARNSDGTLKWPGIRDQYAYGSVERRLERLVIRELLRNATSDQLVLRGESIMPALGIEWKQRIQGLSSKSLSDVAAMVTEACVRVSVVVCGDTVSVRVY
jgi:hypothetical protein